MISPVKLAEKQARMKEITAFVFENITLLKTDFNKESLKDKIESIFHLHFTDLLDYPYIALYRKEVYEPDLTLEDFWNVVYLEKEFEQFILLKTQIETWLKEVNLPQGNIEEILFFCSEACSIVQLQETLSFLNEIKGNSILSFVNKFSVSSFDLLSNCKSEDKVKPPTPETNMEALAKAFVSKEYPLTQAVEEAAIIKGARMYSKNPILLDYLYSKLYPHLVVSAKITIKGRKELIMVDKFYFLSLIEKKPLSSFLGTDFLALHEMSTKGLVELNFSIAEEKISEISQELEENLVVGVNDTYSKLRLKILQYMIKNDLFGRIYNRAREILLQAAETIVIKEAASSFYNMISNKGLAKVKKGVLALFYCPIMDKTAAALLNSKEELIESHILESISCDGLANFDLTNSYNVDLAPVIKAMRNNLADHIVIAANHSNALTLKKLIKDTVAFKSAKCSINFYYSETFELLLLCKPSPRGILVDQAISLARHQFSPKSEILKFFNRDPKRNFCNYLKIHPLLKLINKSKLTAAFELVAVRAVNEEGISINKLVKPADNAYLTNFLCGIGPKTVGLIGKTDITSRKDLSLLKEKIGFNLAPFVYFEDSAENSIEDLLEKTRIPSEMYELAYKIGESAKNSTFELKSDFANKNSLFSLEFDPNLDPSTKEKLKFIQTELLFPFYSNPTNPKMDPMSLLHCFLGTTSETLYPGAIIQGVVVSKDSEFIKIRLNGSICGAIPSTECKNPKIGAVLKAAVKEVDTSNFTVKLTSDLAQTQSILEGRIAVLDYLTVSQVDCSTLLDVNDCFLDRKVNSKHFRNLTYSQSRKYLLASTDKYFLFRPIKGRDDALYLTIQVKSNVFFDYPILKKGKEGSNIGIKYVMKGNIYDNLEKISVSAVNKVLKLVGEVKENEHYADAKNLNGLTEKMLEDKQKDKYLLAYRVGFVPEMPESVGIVWLLEGRKSNVERISLDPQGLKFHDNKFDSFEEVLNFFKLNCSKSQYLNFIKQNDDKRVVRIDDYMENLTKTPDYLEEMTFGDLEEEEEVFLREKPLLEKKREREDDYINTRETLNAKSEVRQAGFEEKSFYSYGNFELKLSKNEENADFDRNNQDFFAQIDKSYAKERNNSEMSEYNLISRDNSKFEGQSQFRRNIDEFVWSDGEIEDDCEQFVGSTNSYDTHKLNKGYREEKGNKHKSQRKPVICHKCGEEGHINKECSKRKKSVRCYNCNQEGHISRDCSQKREVKQVKCYNCNQEGHISRECKNSKNRKQHGNSKGSSFFNNSPNSKSKQRSDWKGASKRKNFESKSKQGSEYSSANNRKTNSPKKGWGGSKNSTSQLNNSPKKGWGGSKNSTSQLNNSLGKGWGGSNKNSKSSRWDKPPNSGNCENPRRGYKG